jgi:hypothetical protein
MKAAFKKLHISTGADKPKGTKKRGQASQSTGNAGSASNNAGEEAVARDDSSQISPKTKTAPSALK